MLFPERLQPYAQDYEFYHKLLEAWASLRCSCGSEDFDVFHNGTLVRSILFGTSVRHAERLIVESACAHCGRCAVLFDGATDGSMTEGDVEPSTGGAGKEAACKRCGRGRFKLRMRLKYHDLDELEGEEDPGRRYEQIWIDLTCSACRATMRSYVSEDVSEEDL